MQPRLSAGGDPLVENLAVEVVDELEGSRNGAVGPCVGARLTQESPSARELRAALLHLLDVEARAGRHGGGRELRPDHGGRFEHPLVLWVKPVGVLLEQLAKRLGHVHGQLLLIAFHPPTAVLARERAILGPLPQQALHEQRVAVCARVHERGKRLRSPVAVLEVAADRLRRQRRQRELDAAAPRSQLSPQLLHGRVVTEA